MTQQEKENIQDDIESIKAFGAYEDDLEKQKQSPLDAFKDALKSEKQRESQQLLDDFAKAAMQGMISNAAYDQADTGFISELAYNVAEAMTQERERRIKG